MHEKLKWLDEEGEVLTLLDEGRIDEATGISGWLFTRGATGLYAWGDGTYTISEEHNAVTGQCSYLYKYRWVGGILPFVLDV